MLCSYRFLVEFVMFEIIFLQLLKTIYCFFFLTIYFITDRMLFIIITDHFNNKIQIKTDLFTDQTFIYYNKHTIFQFLIPLYLIKSEIKRKFYI